MNRELPDERIPHKGGNWQHVIIQICVGNQAHKRRWLEWTRVTHQAGGKVTVQSHGAPPEGWREHWRRYRSEHPELEQYWDESRAVYPNWGPP
jgi:hypothetical protein